MLIFQSRSSPTHRCITAFVLTFLALSSATIAANTHGTGVPVDLAPFFNAKAASTGVNNTFADFDGSGRAYPAEYLPAGPSFVYSGIEVCTSTTTMICYIL